MSNLKKCSKCKKLVPHSRNKCNPDGLRSGCKECKRKHDLQYRYKLSVEDYDRMFEEQGGRCDICNKPPNGTRLSVDHDHACCEVRSCGECVRGLLCIGCNRGLYFIEKHSWRIRALAYLDKHKKKVNNE
jgi:hypothetical protein